MSPAATLVSRASAVLRLTRPLNLTGIGLCIATSMNPGGSSWALETRDAVIVGGWVLLAAGGYVLDDVRDIASDARFHPQRPIPSGLVPPGLAFLVAIGLLAAGAAALALARRGLWAVGLATALVLYGYGERLKRVSGFAANVTVSVLLATAAVSGGLRWARWPAVAALGLMTFSINVGREIVMDIDDIDGDRELGYRTVPLTRGVSTARELAACFLLFGACSGYLLPMTGAVWPMGFTLGLTLANLALARFVLAPLMAVCGETYRLAGLVKGAMFAYLVLIALLVR